jgi:hypothetical protein
VNTENLRFNDGRNRENIENLPKTLPLDVAIRWPGPHAIFPEAIQTIEVRTLMIPTQHKEGIRVLDFVCEEKADALD